MTYNLGLEIIKYDGFKIEFFDKKQVMAKYRPKRKQNSKAFVLPANYDTLSYFQDNIGKFYQIQEDFELASLRYQWMRKFKTLANDIDPEFVQQLNLPDELDFLRPYQKVDAYLMSLRTNFANLSTMRSGKTPTTAASLHLRYLTNKAVKTIISIPKQVNKQWIMELTKICPEYEIIDLTSSNSVKERKAQWLEFLGSNQLLILLVNREKLNRDLEYWTILPKGKNPRMLSRKVIVKSTYGLVVDEAHFLRNFKTDTSKVHHLLSEFADFRVLLTGTKLANKGEDAYGLFNNLFPQVYKSYWDFAMRFFNQEQKYYGQVTFNKFEAFYEWNKVEFNRLFYMNSVERSKEEIMNYLPKYEKVTQLLRLSKSDQDQYEKVAISFEYDTDDDFRSLSSYVALRTKLLQLASNSNKKVITKTNDKKEIIDSITGVKIDWLIEWLEENPDTKPLIFGRFSNTTLKPLFDLLVKKGFRAGLITGDTSDKGQVALDWQNGKLDVLIGNLQSMGTGLTLDYADTTIFLERSDNYAENIQAEERMTATKANDQRSKQVIQVLVEDTMEVVQYEQQLKKKIWVEDMKPSKIYLRLEEIEKFYQAERRGNH